MGALITWRGALAAAVVTCLVGALAPTAVPHASADLPPPSKRVLVVTDSVGLSAKDAIPAAFPPDWQVTVDGQAALFVEQLESKFVRPRMTTSPSDFGDYAVVAGGYNYPYWDPARFDRSIDSMIAALEQAGTKYIFWVTLREVQQQYVSASAWQQVQPYYWYFPEVNAHLRAAMARHPDLYLVDWAANANQPGLTYDAIHLNTTGQALYSRLIAQSVTAASRVVPGGSITPVPTGVPATATAALANLTMVDGLRPGFITADRCSVLQPGAQTQSNGNYPDFDPVANLSVVPVDADGRFCIYNLTPASLLADIQGWFAPPGAPGGLLFTPAAPPRLLDTRQLGGVRAAGSITRVDTGAVGAGAVLVNLTMTDGTSPGFITADRCSALVAGAPQTKSNGNYSGPGAVANLSVVPVDADGSFCIFNLTPVNLAVDLQGTFAGTGLGFASSTPQRLLDTRTAGGPRPAGTITRVDTGAVGAGAVLVNLTMVDATAPGFVTADRCSALQPGTQSRSNGNYAGGAAVANLSVVPVDADGAFCIFNLTPVDVAVDLQGSFAAAGTQQFFLTAPHRALDTRPT